MNLGIGFGFEVGLRERKCIYLNILSQPIYRTSVIAIFRGTKLSQNSKKTTRGNITTNRKILEIFEINSCKQEGLFTHIGNELTKIFYVM